MLFIIGTGMNLHDIPYSSVENLRLCDLIFLENYTATAPDSVENLEKILHKKIILADRIFVESATEILKNLKEGKSVGFLVVGTPFFATTHLDFLSRVRKVSPVKIVHNASIQNCTGVLGLSPYRFGQTVSIPHFNKQTKLISIYDKYKINRAAGLHTLFLLDIKVEHNYFMRPDEALDLLLCLEEETGYGLLCKTDKIFIISQFGNAEEKITYMTVEDALKETYDSPLYSLVVPGKVELYEEDLIKLLF